MATQHQRVIERVVAMMSVLREFTAECRAVEEAATAAVEPDGCVIAVREILPDLNLSLHTLRSRANELTVVLADDSLPVAAFPGPIGLSWRK